MTKYNHDQVIAQAVAALPQCESIADIARTIDIPSSTLRDILAQHDMDYAALATAAAQEAEGSFQLLREQAKHWKRVARRYEKALTNRRWLRDEVAGLVSALEPVPVPPVQTGKSMQAQVGVLEYSDPHFGLSVPPGQLGILGQYNSDLAEERTLRTFHMFAHLCHMRPFPVDKVKVYMLGDNMENSNMRPSQAKQTDAHVVQQTVRFANVAAHSLRFLCGGFESVEVEAVPGNHARVTQKAGDNLPDETFDHLAYYMIQLALKDQPNFKINIHEAWYFVDQIFSWKFLGLHGEDVLCFAPGAPVILSNWTSKPIEQVEIGDAVLCHDGKSRSVVNIHQRHQAGKMVVLSAAMLPTPTLTATPNHEVPVVFASQICCPHHKHMTMQGQRCSQATCGHDFVTPEIQWVPIGHVSPGDYLVVPVPKPSGLTNEYIIRDFLPTLPERLHPREKAIPASIPVSEDLGLVVGQYLADGSCAGRSDKHRHRFHNNMEIVFHEEEEQFWLETMEAFKHIFSSEGSLVTRTDMAVRAQRVQFYSHRAATFIGALAGHGARTKRLHESVLQWPVAALKALMVGYLRGDGHTARRAYHGAYNRTHRVVATTMSIDLGWQLFWVARRCGYSPSLKIRNRSGSWEAILSFFGDDARELGPLAQRNYQAEGDEEIKSQRRATCIDCGDFLLVKVQAAYQIDYDGPTYDLTVEEAHTYIVNGAGVHNSWAGIPFYGIERAVKDYYMMLGMVTKENLRKMDPTTRLAIDQVLGLLDLPDYVCIGHFHNKMVWDVMGVEVLANGTLAGVSLYGTKRKRRLSKPSQQVFWVHPEHGVGERCPINLAQAT